MPNDAKPNTNYVNDGKGAGSFTNEKIRHVAIPTGDTFAGTVYSKGPNGSAVTLSAGGWGDHYYPFIIFDIASIPAQFANYNARLWIYVSSLAPNGPGLKVYRVAASWNENTLTSTNWPNYYTTIRGTFSTLKLGWNSVDITALYQLWKNDPVNYPNYGLMFRDSNNSNTVVYFSSKEGQYAPYLELTKYSPITTPDVKPSTTFQNVQKPLNSYITNFQLPLAAANDTSIGTIAWTSPTNVLLNDTQLAVASIPGSGSAYSQYLKTTQFSFNIPVNAIITGIEAVINRKCNIPLPGAGDYRVRIVKNGVIGSTAKEVTGTIWPTTLTLKTYGGLGDLWGETWTAADINSNNFGLALAAQIVSIQGAPIAAMVDSIQIKVYYDILVETIYTNESKP